MKIRDLKKLKPGDRVFWNDPDDAACSGWWDIKQIWVRQYGETTIVNPKGDILEATGKELQLTETRMFNIGDRVKFDPPRPAFHACVHGQVVYYKGRHSKRNPRVRWASGWGTTVPADELGLLTETELKTYPPVTLVDIDIEIYAPARN